MFGVRSALWWIWTAIVGLAITAAGIASGMALLVVGG